MPTPSLDTSPDTETERLRTLHSLLILDTPPDEGLDMLVALVKKLYDVPIALISLVDEKRQWFKAKIGLDLCETERQHAFCAHTIMSDDVMVVPDTAKDPRFQANPYVIGAPWIRSYAGAPIKIRAGQRIGTLCVLDIRPRQFSDDQIEMLSQLASLVAGRAKLLTLGVHARERAQLLAEANKLAARAQVILSTMSDGVVVQDMTGAIVSVNDSACVALGLTGDQLMGLTSIDPRWRSVDMYGGALPGEQHPAMVTLATGRPVDNFILGIEQPDSARRWLRVSSRPLFENDQNTPSHAVVTFSDITEMVEKGQALKRAQELADAANHAKGAFLANMSHEIRTPLNGVIGLTSVLGRTDLNASQREMVELIRASGETLERLLSDILDVSKIEAGKLEILTAPLDLHETVTSAARLFGLRADDLGIKFDVRFGPDTSGLFIGDGARIRQIISNLTCNALKFTTKGGVTIEVDVEDRPSTQVSTWLILKISDTGIGFDDVTAHRLFSRFEQADSSITRAFGGSGLGLAICRSLTQLMGGSISAQSVPRSGSTFKVTLPLKRLEQTPTNSAELAQESDPSDTMVEDHDDEPLRVLMAEDHLINQRVASLCLAPWGAEITIANNGNEAVDAFKLARFDIVLMDMQMPEMDGLEATRQIRQFEATTNAPRTPIAMLSANAMAEHVAAARAAGCDHHIAKPITPESLGLGLEETMRQCDLATIAADATPATAAQLVA